MKLEELKQKAINDSVPIMMDEGIDFICNYIKTHNVKRILELGTGVGYSSIKFASLADDIFVSTIEIDFMRYKEAYKNVYDLGLQDRITVFFGDALTYSFVEDFDLIFIDAAKAQYIKFFECYKNNLSKDGVFISDNLFFHGMVKDPSLTHNYSTKKLLRKIKKYITFLETNTEFDTTFYELGDGVAVSKRKVF